MHSLGSRDTKFLAVSCALAVAVCLPSIDAMAKYLSATYSVIMIVWVRLTLGSFWVGWHVWRECGVAALALYTTLTRAVSVHDEPRVTAFAGPFCFAQVKLFKEALAMTG